MDAINAHSHTGGHVPILFTYLQVKIGYAKSGYQIPPGKVSIPACAPMRLYIVTSL